MHTIPTYIRIYMRITVCLLKLSLYRLSKWLFWQGTMFISWRNCWNVWAAIGRTNAWTGFLSTVARGVSFREQESVASYCKRSPLGLQLHGRILPSAHLNPEWVNKTLMLLLGFICLRVYTGCCWAKTSREEVHSSTEAVWTLQGRFQQGFVWPQYVYVYQLQCALCTTHLIISFICHTNTNVSCQLYQSVKYTFNWFSQVG